jgi:hypothetical protein
VRRSHSRRHPVCQPGPDGTASVNNHCSARSCRPGRRPFGHRNPIRYPTRAIHEYSAIWPIQRAVPVLSHVSLTALLITNGDAELCIRRHRRNSPHRQCRALPGFVPPRSLSVEKAGPLTARRPVLVSGQQDAEEGVLQAAGTKHTRHLRRSADWPDRHRSRRSGLRVALALTTCTVRRYTTSGR